MVCQKEMCITNITELTKESKMTEKFAVFIDIDGTLVDGKGTNPKNIVAVQKARSMGHYIFINTGRAKAWIYPELFENLDFDGVISGIGSLVEVGGKPIFEKLIDQSFVYEAAKHFWNTENCFFISGEDKGFILNPLPYFEKWNFSDIGSPEDFKGRYQHEKIQKIEIFGKNISNSDKNFLGKELDVYDHKSYIECAPRGCKKSLAMDIVLDYLGIKKENSIAIGDSVNDLDMLKNAGTAVAMGNAIDSVKEIADFISTSCSDGGVGYAIEKLILKS